jgi:hypothetical protein
MGSVAVLGTGNIGGQAGVQSGKATSVVNIWAIYRGSGESPVGYVVKTSNGALWYEPPVEGLQYQPLDDAQSHVLADQHLTFVSCFRDDLRL